MKAKKDYDAKKLSKNDIEKVKKEGNAFIKFMVSIFRGSAGANWRGQG